MIHSEIYVNRENDDKPSNLRVCRGVPSIFPVGDSQDLARSGSVEVGLPWVPVARVSSWFMAKNIYMNILVCFAMMNHDEP